MAKTIQSAFFGTLPKRGYTSVNREKAVHLLPRIGSNVPVRMYQISTDFFAGILSELEREKAKHGIKEKEVTALQMRLEREKDYLGKKINSLEQEMQRSREIAKQQLEAERNTHQIEIETKRIEIDGLKRQLSLQNNETQGSRLEWEELKRKLARKDAELAQKTAENSSLSATRKLEIKALKTDLQCAKIEHQLSVHRNSGMANYGHEPTNKIKELSQLLKALKKESEGLKTELSRTESIL